MSISYSIHTAPHAGVLEYSHTTKGQKERIITITKKPNLINYNAPLTNTQVKKKIKLNTEK